MSGALLTALVVLAAVVLMANQVFMLWIVMSAYRPEKVPDFPAEEVLKARRLAIISRVMRLGSYLAIGGIVLGGAQALVPFALIALGLSLASMLIRPASKVLDARVKEASRQERAARLATRVARAAGKKK